MTKQTGWGAIVILLVFCSFPLPQSADAQQINVTVPYTNVSDSYYERMGVNFGARFGSAPANGSGSFGFFNFGQGPGFSQGSFGPTIPPFGGYDPSSSARFGFGQLNPNGSGYSLNFEMGKGSTRSVSSSAPSLTVQNGYGGSLFSGQLSPFVTSVVPVLGGRGNDGVIDNGVTRAMSSGLLDLTELGERLPETVVTDSRAARYASSTATLGEKSVKAIRAEQEARQSDLAKKIGQMRDNAAEFIESGEYGQARLQLKRALALEKDPASRSEIIATLNTIGK